MVAATPRARLPLWSRHRQAADQRLSPARRSGL